MDDAVRSSKQTELAPQASTPGLRVDDLVDLLSSLSWPPSASQERGVSEAGVVDVSAPMQEAGAAAIRSLVAAARSLAVPPARRRYRFRGRALGAFDGEG